MTFPVGYHSLHPDASMNFQMNRWFGWVGAPDMLEEMRSAALRIVVAYGVLTSFLEQGMHVTGTTSAFDFLRTSARLQTRDISASITQDVLLMAGSEDHYVPMQQLTEQMGTLGNARSITARLFTRSECAQNHCQVGNYGLALETIVNWLDAMLLEHAKPGALMSSATIGR